MDMTTLIGTLAATLTTISFLPQAIKTIRTKDTESISLPMYVLFVIGIAFWICFGILQNITSIIVGNVITFLLSGIILVYKIRGDMKK